jgi:hypothetical protein
MTSDGDLTYGYDGNGNRLTIGYPGAVTATYGHLPGVGPTPEGKSSIRVFQKMTGMLIELEKAHIYIEQLNECLEEKDAEIRALEERLTRLELADPK